MSRILLINDVPSFGKIATAVMNPILSYLNHEVYILPTVIVSNPLSYPEYEMKEMTDYMKGTLKAWQSMKISFDCICTGFLSGVTQFSWIEEVLKNYPESLILVDPIMADHGRLYQGLIEETPTLMKQLGAYADVLLPNFTEAILMTKANVAQNSVSRTEIIAILESLHSDKAKSVVITSVPLEGQWHVCGSDGQNCFFLPYQWIDIHLLGTGDIFSAVVVTSLLEHFSLKQSVLHAMDFISQIMLTEKKSGKNSKHIQIEKYLSLLQNKKQVY